MPLQIPLYTTDNIYASYLDRLLVKSLGVQPGVVEENDYKVSAGSGLQVKVEKGKAFVAETGAIEESNNSFFNGLYNVLSSTESTPYNNVEVSSVNPQIAQIILRVYDVEELKISGQSYARLEWLNGTPNAGATKAHIEEGKAEEFGAKELPQSCYKLAYIVIPKNATKSSEFSIVDKRKLPYEKYTTKNYTKGEAETGVTPSIMYPSVVNLTVYFESKVRSSAVFNVGGVQVVSLQFGASIEGGVSAVVSVPLFFYLNPGESWKLVGSEGLSASMSSATKIL